MIHVVTILLIFTRLRRIAVYSERMRPIGTARFRDTVLKRRFLGVHDSSGSAETLVRRGEIRNHRSIMYFLSNISAKNYQNRLMQHQCRFLRHSVDFAVMLHVRKIRLTVIPNHEQFEEAFSRFDMETQTDWPVGQSVKRAE